MKIIGVTLLLISFSVKASPLMSVKERLRLHLWFNGLEEETVKEQPKPKKLLPEELERPLKKI